MPNINAFRPVIHGEKKMFQVFCYINLYKHLSPLTLRAWLFITPETLFEQT